jgi:hypothetical protein
MNEQSREDMRQAAQVAGVDLDAHTGSERRQVRMGAPRQGVEIARLPFKNSTGRSQR